MPLEKNNKLFIWLSGTGWTKERSEEALGLEQYRQEAIKVVTVDGPATLASVESEIHETQRYPDYIQKPINQLKINIDFNLGYREKTLKAYLKVVKKALEDIPEGTDVIIGGHSRGAAIALSDLIFEMSNMSETTEGLKILKKMNSVNLIAVDPVPGPFSSADRGLSKKFLGNNKIKKMIAHISTRVGQPHFFTTPTVFYARYHDKLFFGTDTNWKDLVSHNEGDANMYAAGFKHQAMMEKDDLSLLYPNPDITPYKLLLKIIDHALGLANIEEVNHIAIELEKIEISLIDSLIHGDDSEKIEFLKEMTSKSYFQSVNPTNPSLGLSTYIKLHPNKMASKRAYPGNRPLTYMIESVKNDTRPARTSKKM